METPNEKVKQSLTDSERSKSKQEWIVIIKDKEVLGLNKLHKSDTLNQIRKKYLCSAEQFKFLLNEMPIFNECEEEVELEEVLIKQNDRLELHIIQHPKSKFYYNLGEINGKKTIITAKHSGKCFDVLGSNKNCGAKLI